MFDVMASATLVRISQELHNLNITLKVMLYAPLIIGAVVIISMIIIGAIEKRKSDK